MSLAKSILLALLLSLPLTGMAQHTIFFEDFTPTHSKAPWTFDSDKWAVDNFTGMPSGKPALTIAYIKNNPVFGEPLRGVFRAISPKIQIKDHQKIHATILLYFESNNDIMGKSFNIEYRTHDSMAWCYTNEPVALTGANFGQVTIELPDQVDADSVQFSLTFRSLNANTNSQFALFLDDFRVHCVDMYSVLLKSETPNIQSFTNPIMRIQAYNQGRPYDSLVIGYSKGNGVTQTYTHYQKNPTYGYQNIDFALTSYFLSPGNKKVKLWIEKINDKTPEYPLVRDTLTICSQMINYVDSNSTRYDMLEYFGSNQCPFCISLNNNIVSPIIHDSMFINRIACAYIPLEFPLSEEGLPDPFFYEDLSVRQRFYNIKKAPTLVLNGKDFNFPTYDLYANALRHVLTKTPERALFKINLHCATIDPNTFRVHILGDYISHFRDSINVYIYVIDRVFTGAVTPDGHSEFFDIVMTGIPSMKGKTLHFDRDTIPFYWEYLGIKETFIQDHRNLTLVMFLQDIKSKEIFQSIKVPIKNQENTANKSVTKPQTIHLEPNPASDQVLIHLPYHTPGELSIYNLKGQLIYQNSKAHGLTHVHCQSWERGFYVVHWVHQNEVFHTKLLLH